MNFLIRFRFRTLAETVAAATVAATVVTVLGYRAYRAYKTKIVVEPLEPLEPLALEPLEPLEPFENKFFKEYDELEDDPNAPVPRACVRETTPQGDVIMTYDADRAVFCYYCDKRSVQFKYLEPVARKYVITHGCKRLYIDFRKELTKADAQAKANKSNKANKANKSNADTAKPLLALFARFKTYTRANDDRVVALKEQVTRYLHCGRLDDYDSGEAHEAHDFNIIKPIDYASYKKMIDS